MCVVVGKAMMRLCKWVGSSEPSLLTNSLSTKFSRAVSNVYLDSYVHEKMFNISSMKCLNISDPS